MNGKTIEIRCPLCGKQMEVQIGVTHTDEGVESVIRIVEQSCGCEPEEGALWRATAGDEQFMVEEGEPLPPCFGLETVFSDGCYPLCVYADHCRGRIEGEEEKDEDWRYELIYFRLINIYNKRKQHYTHFVRVAEDRVMVIEWDGHWKPYVVYELEDASSVERNIGHESGFLRNQKQLRENPHALFVVRLYDGFDNEWMDVTEPVEYREAKEVWLEKTEQGTEKTCFDDIDYYDIYPADTKMLYDVERN